MGHKEYERGGKTQQQPKTPQHGYLHGWLLMEAGCPNRPGCHRLRPSPHTSNKAGKRARHDSKAQTPGTLFSLSLWLLGPFGVEACLESSGR
eukprot:5307771-Amphidinium_carterae.1